MIPAVAAAISRLRRRAAAAPNRATAALFAALAYVPMLLTAPGRVSADTKTYLTLDPGDVLASASSMWDPGVGAGTVPHQNIGYLFPLAPYYRVMEAVSVPDWFAQRLLWATLVFAAAFGAYRLMRWLSWSATAALIVGLAYGFSPYVLSYLARLSAILGPWAAMPWLLLFAAMAMRTRSWRPAAWFALVVALVGSVNATSLVLAGLAVVIWLVVDLVGRRVAARDAAAGVVKIGVLCLGVSAWWIAGLRVQGAYGIPILRYTETYQAVASSSTPPEILRGLGYWFFYGGDRLDTWVGPSAAYIDRPVVMLLGFGLAGCSLLGLSTIRQGRMRAVALLLVGLVVSVGAAPLDNSTLYGRVFEWFATESTAGAALRSTPRAAPLVILALAMGLGAGTEAVVDAARRRQRWSHGRILIPTTVALAVCLQMFPWFTGRATTPSLERDESLPMYVTDLAAWLDHSGDGRIYAMPGSDFANYRWGGTVDPVLPGLVDRDVLYRELVPQGGAGTADLLNAFERRLAEGWFEPSALLPVAELFDVETIVVRNDLEHERYRLARPGPLWSDVTSALAEPDHVGPLVGDRPEIPLVDEAALARSAADRFPVVAAFDVGTTSLASVSTMPPQIVAGSGDGLVDLAAAGLLDPRRPVLYAASLDGIEAPAGSWWVVTDTNRKQGRHWSTIGSNLGALEAEGPLVIDEDPGDQQLDVFPSQTIADQTIAVHRGSVADVRASYYGNKIAYTPEDAPFFALDGDLTTAWRAGVFDETIGLVWEVELAVPAPTDQVTIVQPLTGVVDRHITDVRITLDDDQPVDFVLNEASRSETGQSVILPRRGYSSLRIEVRNDNLGRLSTYAGRPGVGLAEVLIPGITDDRVVRVPTDVAAGPDERLTYLFTRQRIDPATSNRSAPEPSLVREFTLNDDRSFDVAGTGRLSSRATEPATQALLGENLTVFADRRLPGDVGSRGAAAYDGDLSTAWQTPFDDSIGAQLSIPGSDHGPPDDRLILVWLDDGRHSIPTEITVRQGETSQVVAVPPVDPVDGLASTSIPLTTSAGRVTITITGLDARTSPEYFSGVQQTLPVGIVEVGLEGADGRVSSRLEASCRSDLLLVDGEPVSVRILGDANAALDDTTVSIEACDPLTLRAGTHRLTAIDGAVTGIDIDRIGLDAPGDSVEPSGTVSSPAVVNRNPTAADVTIDPQTDDSWLTWNQSLNSGWTASIDGVDLGPPRLTDGYANGWRLPASTEVRTVELRWTPQRNVDVALLISAIFGLIILALLLVTHRSKAPATDETTSVSMRLPTAPLALGLGLVVFALGGLPAALAAVGLVLIGDRVPWLPTALIGFVWTLVTLGIVGIEFRRDYPAGPDWPSRFGWASSLTWIVVVAVIVPVVARACDRRPHRNEPMGSDATGL